MLKQDAKPARGLIPKSELRKIKQRVAKLRKQGHDIWTDDEVEAEGWTVDVPTTPAGLHVAKEKQKESWDCGLACVQMVIGVLSDDYKPTPEFLQSRIAAPSVWTIDLAYLLSEFGVACEFLTAAPVLDMEAYKGSTFYEASFDADARRVDLLLRAAKAEGLEVRKCTLSATELWNLMSEEETLVIALVDARLLHARVRASNGDPAADPAAFMGHYVLLVGLDDERGGYVVNDPARDDERTFVHADALEAARHAAGTDDDLLLISAYQGAPTPPAAESTPKILRVYRERAASSAGAVENALR